MIKEQRIYKIKWRVISANNIRHIAQLAQREYQSSKSLDHHANISYKLNCEDSSSYVSDSTSLFEEGGNLDIKKALMIQINYHDYTNTRDIDIVIKEGSSNSYFEIEGEDRNWVSGVFAELEEHLKSIKPQNQFLIKYKPIIIPILSLIIGYSISSLLDCFIFNNLELPTITNQNFLSFVTYISNNPLLRLIISILLRTFQGFISFTYPIYNWLLELWPVIEFDFGPEHYKIIKKRRSRVIFILTMLILPITIEKLF